MCAVANWNKTQKERNWLVWFFLFVCLLKMKEMVIIMDWEAGWLYLCITEERMTSSGVKVRSFLGTT